MAKSLDAWIHNFTVTDCETHKKGYTVYKITSIIFPVFVPESLTCLTVWKRYNEVKKLRKQIVRRHRSMSAPPVPPLSDDGYFRRFDADVILARKQHILNVLDYIAQYPYLYKSHAFVQFFEASQTPSMSPLKRRRDSNQCGGAIEVPDNDDCLTVLSSSLASSSTISSDTTSACSEAEDAGATSPASISPPRDDNVGDDVDEVDCAVEAFDDGQSECSAVAIVEQDAVPRTGSSGDYIFEAALEFSEAVRAEVARSYRPAFELYKSGIGKLIRGVRADANAERRRVAKDKINKYMLRAEQIHACHLFGSAVSRPSDAKRGRTQMHTADRLESFEELSRFKVLCVLHGVMQVQDTVDQTIYIMKTIEKPSNFSVKLLEHSRPVPGMVSLVRFFVSETTVYLLLQQASGGRLFDYMRTYQQDTETETQAATDKTTLNSLFCVPSHPVAALNVADDPTDSDDVDDDAFLGTLRRLRTPIRQLSHSSATPNSLDEAIASMDENAPAFDMLTPSMDVSDLLDCSQKLLDSVTSTIERSHVEESTSPTLPNPVEAIFLRQGALSDARRSSESSILRRSHRMAAAATTAKVTANRSLTSQIPLRTIVRWASELCRTISALHDNGIHCGDLNASNCLLGSGGQLLLSYFHRGASGANISPLALDGVYVAPERPLTVKSDWWSFGVLLFEMLTGERFVDCHPGGAAAYYDIQYPDGVGLSAEAKDLLAGTIQSDVARRLDGDGVRAHAFFGDIQWKEVE